MVIGFSHRNNCTHNVHCNRFHDDVPSTSQHRSSYEYSHSKHYHCLYLAVRLTILSLHGFSHVMSSTQVRDLLPFIVHFSYQEFLFATDRAMASSYPLRYHDGSIAVKSLLLGEVLSVSYSPKIEKHIYFLANVRACLHARNIFQ